MTAKQKVWQYPTKSKMGFTKKEIDDLLREFPGIKMSKFDDALRGITCMMNEDKETIIYHCDIEHALYCGLENRNLRSSEWD